MTMTNSTISPTESALAADEFALWIKKYGSALRKQEDFEVRPCKGVRGFILRLPGIGWRLWFQTRAEAVNFAGRVASVYTAKCLVFDELGKLID